VGGERTRVGEPLKTLGRVLPRSFYDRPVLEVARDLLGAVVVHSADGVGEVAVRLSELEAYAGGHDPASHAFRGRTDRNAVMFGPAGHAYVYFTYGMHFCMNLVTGSDGHASAVLLRAGEVVAGDELMAVRRPGVHTRDLARGPARLTMALGIDRALNGADVTSPQSPLQVRRGTPITNDAVRWGPRVGVSTAQDVPWRCWIDGDATVSSYRPHVPKKRRK
jgi:DNA-3-methyladenine glycosylase